MTTKQQQLEDHINDFQTTLTRYINNKLDYMQQEITMLNKRIDNIENGETNTDPRT